MRNAVYPLIYGTLPLFKRRSAVTGRLKNYGNTFSFYTTHWEKKIHFSSLFRVSIY